MPCKLGCGVCCEAILIPSLSKERYNKYVNGELHSEKGEDAYHVAFNMKEITREEAETINPFLKTWPDGAKDNGMYFTCNWYDKTKKLCGHHDERPVMCSAYPFYRHMQTFYSFGKGDNDIAPIKEDLAYPYTDKCGYLEDEGKTIAQIKSEEPTEEDIKNYLATLEVKV